MRRFQSFSTARACAYPVIDFKPVTRGFEAFTAADWDPVVDMVKRLRKPGPVRHRGIAFRTAARTDRGAPAIHRGFRARGLCPLPAPQSSRRGEWSKGDAQLRT